MQKIVCNQCGGKWYVDNADITQMKCCLYCKKPLRQKKEITTLDTLDKVIFKAVSSLGMDALSQPHQLAGYMMDIAPEFKRELRISKLAIGIPSTNQQIHTDRPSLDCRELLQKTA